MTFVDAEGDAYRRQHAGIPSGMLSTQFTGSFCSLFLLFEGLVEYTE